MASKGKISISIKTILPRVLFDVNVFVDIPPRLRHDIRRCLGLFKNIAVRELITAYQKRGFDLPVLSPDNGKERGWPQGKIMATARRNSDKFNTYMTGRINVNYVNKQSLIKKCHGVLSTVFLLFN